ncbi:MAG: DegT/DnrJ/EryC1/StrS family aminotransferase [Sedimentisphaerales bacterium]|nr:DegT/DnrJ/EryC1/StrS family aminotransferase [Sedimentisphaerales bacterium]
MSNEKLAIDGGKAVRSAGWPSRGLIGEEEKAAAMAMFDKAIKTGNAFGYGGEAEQQYEKDFAEFMGGGFADGVNSGTNAVFCALGALHLEPFSEVIIPAITDPGGAMPTVLVGCVPVVADTDEKSYNVGAAQIEAAITERTKAVVVAHIGGEPVDMDAVMALARKHNLYVVEDCAQAHGAKYKGKYVGSFGDIAAYSTMFGKHHCTGGQGGVVYTRNEELFWQAKRFADRGKPFNLDTASNVRAAINCNLNDLSATIGSAQLKKLVSIVARRRKVGETVKAELARKGSVVQVGVQEPETECSYWFLRLALDVAGLKVDKAAFCEALTAEGIPAGLSYRHIPAEAVWFKERVGLGNKGYPWTCSDYKGPREPQYRIDNAIKVTDKHFNIGIHEGCGEQEIADILAAIDKVEKAYRK